MNKLSHHKIIHLLLSVRQRDNWLVAPPAYFRLLIWVTIDTEWFSFCLQEALTKTCQIYLCIITLIQFHKPFPHMQQTKQDGWSFWPSADKIWPGQWFSSHGERFSLMWFVPSSGSLQRSHFGRDSRCWALWICNNITTMGYLHVYIIPVVHLAEKCASLL